MENIIISKIDLLAIVTTANKDVYVCVKDSNYQPFTTLLDKNNNVIKGYNIEHGQSQDTQILELETSVKITDNSNNEYIFCYSAFGDKRTIKPTLTNP